MTADTLERRPTSALSEAILFRGYSRPETTRSCLCGGSIRTIDNERAIERAVGVHNASPEHRAWATAAGWRHG